MGTRARTRRVAAGRRAAGSDLASARQPRRRAAVRLRRVAPPRTCSSCSRTSRWPTVGYSSSASARNGSAGPRASSAAVVLLTREPILSYGIRAYVDVPYLVLVLVRAAGRGSPPARRRAGAWRCSALAGLLRPEAWLFSVAYLVWLWRERRPAPAEIALALGAPLLWLGIRPRRQRRRAALAARHARQHADARARDRLRHVPTTMPRRDRRDPARAGARRRRRRARLRLVASRDKLRPAIGGARARRRRLRDSGGRGAADHHPLCVPDRGDRRRPLRRRAARLAVDLAGRRRTRWTLAAAAVTLLFIVFGPSSRRASSTARPTRSPRSSGSATTSTRCSTRTIRSSRDRRGRQPPAGAARRPGHGARTARRRHAAPIGRARSSARRTRPSRGGSSSIRAIRCRASPRAPDGMRAVARNASWVLYAADTGETSGPCTLLRSEVPGAYAGGGSGPGIPASHVGDRLRLLPSGPDLVHEPTPRGTRAISATSRRADPEAPPLERGFGLARADCERQGTATSPPSTVRRGD